MEVSGVGEVLEVPGVGTNVFFRGKYSTIGKFRPRGVLGSCRRPTPVPYLGGRSDCDRTNRCSSVETSGFNSQLDLELAGTVSPK